MTYAPEREFFLLAIGWYIRAAGLMVLVVRVGLQRQTVESRVSDLSFEQVLIRQVTVSVLRVHVEM